MLAYGRMRHCLALALWAALLAVAPTSSLGADLVLVGAKIYPSPDEAPLENASILIHDGKIQALGPARSVRIPADATRIGSPARAEWLSPQPDGPLGRQRVRVR